MADTEHPRPQSHAGPYLTGPEAAAYLRLSPKTLERMRVDGSGPAFRKAGPGLRSRVLYRPCDLDAWIERFAFTSTSEYGNRRLE